MRKFAKLEPMSRVVDPDLTLAIIVGASRFPKSPNLASLRSFCNSAWDFAEYLGSPRGMGVSGSQILDLFDDSRSPADLLEEVSSFLTTTLQRLGGQNSIVRDLLLYYVGHGLFSRANEYFLAVRATNERNIGSSGIRMADLAHVIKDHARFLRRYLIIDCCFAGAAYQEFQSAPSQLAVFRTLEAFPKRGTALLVSSGAREVALSRAGQNRTMFSDAFLKVLTTPHPGLNAYLSLRQICDLITELLLSLDPEACPRPEVHSPDQSGGDVAGIPLFPNLANFGGRILDREKVESEQRDPADSTSGHWLPVEAAPIIADAEAPNRKSDWSNKTRIVRQLLTDALSDEDLEALAFDYFLPVFNEFSVGMTKKRKIQMLIEHCFRHDVLPEVLGAVRDLNPQAYARYEKSLGP